MKLDVVLKENKTLKELNLNIQKQFMYSQKPSTSSLPQFIPDENTMKKLKKIADAKLSSDKVI